MRPVHGFAILLRPTEATHRICSVRSVSSTEPQVGEVRDPLGLVQPGATALTRCLFGPLDREDVGEGSMPAGSAVRQPFRTPILAKHGRDVHDRWPFRNPEVAGYRRRLQRNVPSRCTASRSDHDCQLPPRTLRVGCPCIVHENVRPRTWRLVVRSPSTRGVLRHRGPHPRPRHRLNREPSSSAVSPSPSTSAITTQPELSRKVLGHRHAIPRAEPVMRATLVCSLIACSVGQPANPRGTGRAPCPRGNASGGYLGP